MVVEGSGVAEYVIFLLGCDVTPLHVELSPTEAALVRALAVMSREVSGSDCQPRMSIVKREPPTDSAYGDKVVSIDEQSRVPSPFGDRARLRLAGGLGERPAPGARGFGCGGGLRAESVDDALPGVAGEDRQG